MLLLRSACFDCHSSPAPRSACVQLQHPPSPARFSRPRINGDLAAQRVCDFDSGAGAPARPFCLANPLPRNQRDIPSDPTPDKAELYKRFLDDLNNGYVEDGYLALRALGIIAEAPGSNINSEDRRVFFGAVMLKIKLLGTEFKGQRILEVSSSNNLRWTAEETTKTIRPRRIAFQNALDELLKIEDMVKRTNNLNHERITSLYKQCVAILIPLGYKFVEGVSEKDQFHAGIVYARTGVATSFD